jgi:tetratricopeptide (TPR) repeat protein
MSLFAAVASATVVAIAVAADAPPAASPAVEAKRKAAAEMLRTNKPADAISFLKEVIAATGGKDWRDHLALARCHDKLGAADDAIGAYQQVLALVPADARSADERAARVDADRRLKVLDASADKVEKSVAEFAKRLDALDREFRAARDARAQIRVARARAALAAAGYGAPNVRAFEVQANALWQDTGIKLTAGRRYRVRALGKWRVNPATECDSEGDKSKPGNEFGHYGALIMQTGANPPFAVIPPEATFAAPRDLALSVTINENTIEAKKDNSGTMFLIVEQLD